MEGGRVADERREGEKERGGWDAIGGGGGGEKELGME